MKFMHLYMRLLQQEEKLYKLSREYFLNHADDDECMQVVMYLENNIRAISITEKQGYFDTSYRY